jgi:four helix bundle protein
VAVGREIRHFKDLLVWQRSHQLFLDVVRDTENLAKNVVSRVIVDQILRSVGSISSNIAEGFNSRTTRQYVSFLDIARRSAAGSENWFYKLQALGSLRKETSGTRINECMEINKMLYGLMKSLKEKPIKRE